MLTDMQTFVAAFDTLFGGFRQRAEATYALLQAAGTAFLVVAAPEPAAMREASYFVERLGRGAMPLAGLVVNRVHDEPAPAASTATTPSRRRPTAAGADADERRRRGGERLLDVHAERDAGRRARERGSRERFTARAPAASERSPVPGARDTTCTTSTACAAIGDLLGVRRR